MTRNGISLTTHVSLAVLYQIPHNPEMLPWQTSYSWFLLFCLHITNQSDMLPWKQEPVIQACSCFHPFQVAQRKERLKKVWRFESCLLAKYKSATRLQLIKGHSHLTEYKEGKSEAEMTSLAPKAFDDSARLGPGKAILNRWALSS